MLFVGILLFMITYVIGNKLKFGLCENVYTFGNYEGCLDKSSQITGKPLFFTSVAILVASLFLFFVHDIVFKKWLRFAMVWILLTIVFVMLAPVSTGGFINFGPTKELVSIWMGVLFVIISLVLIIWQSVKEGKGKKI